MVHPPVVMLVRKADNHILCVDKTWKSPEEAIGPWALIWFYPSKHVARKKHGEEVGLLHIQRGHNVNDFVRERFIDETEPVAWAD